MENPARAVTDHTLRTGAASLAAIEKGLQAPKLRDRAWKQINHQLRSNPVGPECGSFPLVVFPTVA